MYAKRSSHLLLFLCCEPRPARSKSADIKAASSSSTPQQVYVEFVTMDGSEVNDSTRARIAQVSVSTSRLL